MSDELSPKKTSPVRNTSWMKGGTLLAGNRGW